MTVKQCLIDVNRCISTEVLLGSYPVSYIFQVGFGRINTMI